MHDREELMKHAGGPVEDSLTKPVDYTGLRGRMRTLGKTAADNYHRELAEAIKKHQFNWLPISGAKQSKSRREVSKMKEAISKIGRELTAVIVVLLALIILALVGKVVEITPARLIIVGAVVCIIEAINSWESVKKAQIQQLRDSTGKEP